MTRLILARIMILASILASILACGQQAPEYILRGWTPTPPKATSTATPVSTVSAGPTIIYVYPTDVWFSATVRVDQLEIRNGPGTGYPGDASIFLSTGDTITIMACKYDTGGEAWANFYWPKKKLYGWAAVTYRGAIYLWPMPERCTR